VNTKHRDSDEYVRKLSRGGVYLGLIRADHAQQMLRAGTASVAMRSRKRIQAVYVDQGVDRTLPGAVALTYDEHLADTSKVLTLKRYNPEHKTFEKWDQGLTFAEARAGKFVSEATQTARRERTALRRSA
jgi:hypothetical protein